jgi:hypothetical protein
MLHQRGAVMAIKRQIKSRGMPSHKPVASAPLRHVDVRAPQQMVPGEVYVGGCVRIDRAGESSRLRRQHRAAKR